MLKISQSVIDEFGADLPERVAAYATALEAHRFSMGTPRPVEHPLVEAVTQAGGMDCIEIIPTPATEPLPAKNEISKIRLVEALGAAGKLRDAMALLKLEAPVAELTDAELLLREKWLAARSLNPSSPEVAPLLHAIGVDPESLLA